MRFVIFSILIINLCTSCGKNSPCLKSTGKDITISRDLQVFDSLVLLDKIDVELRNSTVNRVTITCGENLADYISTEVTGGILTIENKNKCGFLRSYKRDIKVILEYTSLSKINFISAGLLSNTDTLKQSYLLVEGEGCSGDINLLVKVDSIRLTLHTGNSNVKLKGESSNAFFYSGGTTILHAEQLNCNQTFANNSGSGDYYLFANSYLFAEVNQEGSIFFSGNCNLDAHDNGKGEIIKR